MNGIPPKRFVNAWREALGQRSFLPGFLLALAVFVLGLVALAKAISFVEMRPGGSLQDPVLALFPARDVTWVTFALIYTGIVLGLVRLLPDPFRLRRAVGAYGLLALARLLTMWLTPLDPPAGMIVLRDPFVEAFVSVPTTTRDLFFSGHTSLMFLLFLVFEGRTRIFFALATAGVAFCVIAQHVHYTIDVVAAPFFAWGCWSLSGMWFRDRGSF